MKLRTILFSMTALGMLAGSNAALAQTVDVQQYWTSASEGKAMKEIVDAYTAAGGKWIDSPAADANAALAAATSRIAGGEPPSAILMTPNSAMRDLASSGQLRNFDDIAAKDGWKNVISPLVWDKINVDGHLYGLPVGIHAQNWIWYSKPLLDELGISEPKTLDELFAAADKINASGKIGIAIGGEPWQEKYILWAAIMSAGGPDYWRDLFIDRKPEATSSPILAQAFDTFRRASKYADPSSPGRSWNDTTNLVATGKAGFQFMGDWARGEFEAAGLKAGKDFGCMLAPSAKPGYSILIDLFAFPVNKDQDRIDGQTLLASTLMDPVVEAKVAEAKGSVPVRSDVDTASLDVCAQIGSKALSTPGAAVSAPYDALPGDMAGRITDLITEFWTDQSITTDAAVKAFADILQSQ